MINEKMKILKMLEEGRISAEDAAKLLDGAATEPPRADGAPPPPSPPPTSGAPGPAASGGYGRGAGYHGNESGRHRAEPGSSAGASTSSEPGDKRGTGGGGPSSDLGKRLDNFFSDMEPKLQRLAGTLVEKTAGAADALSRSLASARTTPGAAGAAPPKPQPSATRPGAPPAPRNRAQRDFEVKVTELNSELIIDGKNGQVLLKGYNGDKITAKVYYTAKRGNPPIELMSLGSKYYLHYDENEFENISVDAYIPEAMFAAVRVTNTNGPMVISTVRADEARFENQNGDIEVTGFAAKNLMIETNNGQLRLKGLTAERLGVDNFSGTIAATDVDAAMLKMSTFNGAITLQTSEFAHYAEYKWSIESNNGKTTMILPSSIDIGYHVRANAALSEVRLGLTGLAFISHTKNFAEAESTNFDQAAKKVTLLLETSNFPLVVN